MTLSLIGYPGTDATADRWARQAFGFHDVAAMQEHVRMQADDASSVIVVGRDIAETHGMQRFGLANHVPLAGHQWRRGGTLFTFCPSPAALATMPDGPTARPSLRRVLMAEMVLGCPTLRPWHFRLSDKQTLHDLGVAWCPASPVAGMPFALSSAEAPRRRIEGGGRLAAPGSIDCHTHDDTALLTDPQLTPKHSQCVTTVVTVNC